MGTVVISGGAQISSRHREELHPVPRWYPRLQYRTPQRGITNGRCPRWGMVATIAPLRHGCLASAWRGYLYATDFLGRSLARPYKTLSSLKRLDIAAYHKLHFMRINIRIGKIYAKKHPKFFPVSKFLLYICITNSRHIVMAEVVLAAVCYEWGT